MSQLCYPLWRNRDATKTWRKVDFYPKATWRIFWSTKKSRQILRFTSKWAQKSELFPEFSAKNYVAGDSALYRRHFPSSGWPGQNCRPKKLAPKQAKFPGEPPTFWRIWGTFTNLYSLNNTSLQGKWAGWGHTLVICTWGRLWISSSSHLENALTKL